MLETNVRHPSRALGLFGERNARYHSSLLRYRIPVCIPVCFKRMTLHILRHKSWHVWNQDALDKVRRDEDAHAKQEESLKLQALNAESEARVERLRAGLLPDAIPEGDRPIVKHSAAKYEIDDTVVSRRARHPEREAEKKVADDRARQKAGIPKESTFRDVVQKRSWYELPPSALASSASSSGGPNITTRRDGTIISDNDTRERRSTADVATKSMEDPLDSLRSMVERTRQRESAHASQAQPSIARSTDAFIEAARATDLNSTRQRSASATPISTLIRPLEDGLRNYGDEVDRDRRRKRRRSASSSGSSKTETGDDDGETRRRRRAKSHHKPPSFTDDDSVASRSHRRRRHKHRSHGRHSSRRRRSHSHSSGDEQKDRRSSGDANQSAAAGGRVSLPSLAPGELDRLRVERLVREAVERERANALLLGQPDVRASSAGAPPRARPFLPGPYR